MNEIYTLNSNPALTPSLSLRERGKGEEDLKKAAREFEAFFLNYLLKTMRESVPKDGLFGGGTGEDVYTSMLDEALSKEMAAKGGIGIGELLIRQLEPDKMPDADNQPKVFPSAFR
jgi:flagellar protein FlgJ